MKKELTYILVLLVSIAVAQADEPVDISNLPTGVQKTIKEWKGQGEVKKVKTQRVDGRNVYEVEYKEGGDEKKVWVAEDGSVVDEDQGKNKGKGKGKAKGKAKGHYKDSEEDAAPAKPAPSAAPAPAPTPAPAPAPSRTETPMPTPSTAPAPSKSGTATPHTPQAPASAGTATTPARSAAEVKTELLPRINRINQLEKDPQVARNMLPLISKETGVSVKVLEEQRRLYPVGGGGMLVCNEMAKATHKQASTFLKQRLQNRSWEQIAAENKFDLASVLPKLQRVEESILATRKQPKK